MPRLPAPPDLRRTLRCGAPLVGTLLLLASCAAPPPPAPLADTDRQLRLAAARLGEGKPADARRAYQRALALAERIDDRPRMIEALLGEGASALHLETWPAARAAYAKAGEIARAAGEPPLTAHALHAALGLAETDRRAGRLAEAAGGFTRLRGDPAAPPAIRLPAINGLALIHLARGELSAAEALLNDLRLRLTAGDAELDAATLASLARLRLAQGRHDLALPLARQAIARDRARLDPAAIAADHALLAEIAREGGDPATAQTHTERAAAIRQHLGLPPAAGAR